MRLTKIMFGNGYKAFNKNMTCRNDFKYEVGKTYSMNPSTIKLCELGFHFCRISVDVFDYYNEASNFAIIEANGKIIDGYGKSVCSQITIEKLITLDELYNLTNGKYVRNNGTIEYYQNGRLHRENGPAVERFDGTKFWYLNGERHREDGPAIELSDGTKSWYINGIYSQKPVRIG